MSGRDAYNVSRTVEGTDACLKVGLDKLGITNPSTLFRNLTYQQLFEHEQQNNEGVVAKAEYGDTFTVDTGKYTGTKSICCVNKSIFLCSYSTAILTVRWNETVHCD